MYKNMLDNTEIPEVTEVEQAPIEPIVEEMVEEIAEAPIEEVAEEATEEPAEEVADEVAEETTKEVTNEVTDEAILFDGTEDDAVFTEKKEQVLAKYELPDEITSLIETLQAKAQSVEAPEIFTQIADYGDVDEVTAVLDEHNTLYSRREENGQYRPNTDVFAQKVAEKDEVLADHLYFDLASLPSSKYQGINKFEEGIADALAVDGDTVNMVLSRYHGMMRAMKEGASLPLADVPDFIPPELYGAYKTLAKETREEMSMWDDAELYAPERANKLNELRNIQKGINADIAEQQRTVQVQQERQQRLTNEAVTTQTTFFNEMRKTMADKLKGVQFSSDPKLNTLLSNQQVTTLTQAFLDDSDGEFARQTLAEAGINFDYNKAQKLVNDVYQSAQALTIAKHAVDAKGKPLNPVDLNKAQSSFKTVTQEWLKFADDILKQEKDLATTGTAKALEAEVAKIKVQPKARPVAKSIATAATNGNGDRPPSNILYGSPEWDKWWVKKTLDAESRKASQYV